jgi:hypothetical protein
MEVQSEWYNSQWFLEKQYNVNHKKQYNVHHFKMHPVSSCTTRNNNFPFSLFIYLYSLTTWSIWVINSHRQFHGQWNVTGHNQYIINVIQCNIFTYTIVQNKNDTSLAPVVQRIENWCDIGWVLFRQKFHYQNETFSPNPHYHPQPLTPETLSRLFLSKKSFLHSL